MNDGQKPNNSEIILARNRDLVIKSSRLIERGLQLLKELGKPILRLYMNMDKDEAFVEIFAEIVDSVAQNKFEIIVITNRNVEKLLENAPNDEFAIFLINMSRFIHQDIYPPENIKKHIRKSLQVVTYLKNEFKKPVIVLSTWGNELTEEMAKNAGASYFFGLSLDIEAFKSAIKKSLQQLKKENEIAVSERTALEQPPAVLIVDDDTAVVETLQKYFIEEGFKSFMATSAEEAIPILQNNNIDVVLTDVCMPGMSGLELTKMIKKEYDCDVIIFTGYEKNCNYEQAVQLGASDFFYKPVRLEEVLLRVKRVMIKRNRNRNDLY